MNRFAIGGKRIGDGSPCFVIAEAGSNHNGKLSLAKRLIDVAAASGADAVKFQTFRAETLYVKNAGRSDYLGVKKSIYDIFHEMEMPFEWLSILAKHCWRRGIIFLSSVFDERLADEVNRYVSAHKIASYELNHIPLIQHVASFGKPMILSTGASAMREIEEAVRACRSVGNKKIALMQCTACYPAPLSSLNLKAIHELKRKFHVPVGHSDHSRDPALAPVAAVACEANLIEKHFTLSNKMAGPDHKFALEPLELAKMVQAIRSAEQALGSGVKQVQTSEKELFHFAKRGIQARRIIQKGEPFNLENVACLRPGKRRQGLPPATLALVLRHRARRKIQEGDGIQKSDLA